VATPITTSGSLDATKTVPVRCERLGVSQNFLASYIGISKSELSRCLNGRGMGGERTEQLNKALSELENLVELFQPMPLRFDDAGQIRDLVRASGLMTDDSRERLRGGLAALVQNTNI
jgi:hypothetical protein